MEIFQSGFFNAGIHVADRQKRLSAVFSFRQQDGDGIYAGLKMEKGEDGREQAIFRESGIKKWRAIIKI